ncbi:transposase, partial [Roseovarius sp. MBR-78]
MICDSSCLGGWIMSAPLPDALRARFQKLIEEGFSGRAAALRLKVSPATGARWGLAVRRTGQARAAPQGRPRGKGKLDPHRDFFAEGIAQDGDITMPELASASHDATGEVNQTGFTGEQKARKVSYDQGKPRDPFFDRVTC